MSFQQPDDSSKHQSDHGEDQEGRGGACAVFVVLREPAAAAASAINTQKHAFQMRIDFLASSLLRVGSLTGAA